MVDSTLLEMGAPSEVGAPEESLAILQAAADPVRWQVLAVLAGSGSCVCDLQREVPVAPNLLSYHLRVLREAGLVTATRRGRWVDYALADDASARLAASLPTSGAPAPASCSDRDAQP